MREKAMSRQRQSIQLISIKKKDVPCRQCCNIIITQQMKKYVANSCNLIEMKTCPIWQVFIKYEGGTNNDNWYGSTKDGRGTENV